MADEMPALPGTWDGRPFLCEVPVGINPIVTLEKNLLNMIVNLV